MRSVVLWTLLCSLTAGQDLKSFVGNETSAVTPASLQKFPPISEKPFWMKRGFANGQPELQQAMDNLAAHEQIIKRNMPYPDAAQLTHKTNLLLAEAQDLLVSVQSPTERRWIEDFINRLKSLASVLEQKVAKKASLEPVAPSVEVVSSPSIPSYDPKTKVPTTESSQLSQVLPTAIHPDGHVVQQLRNKKSDEEDELVRELINLRHIAVSEDPIIATPAEDTSPVENPAKRLLNENEIAIEYEKEKIKNILTHEVATLQRLGETPEEILNTLRLEAEKLTVPNILQLPSLNYMQVRIQTLVLRKLLAFLLALLKEGIKDHPSSSLQNQNSVQEAHIIDQNLPNSAIKDLQADESMILQTNRHMWRPSSLVHPLSYPSKDRYMNKSFQGMHVNLPQMNQPMYSRQLQNGQPVNLPHSALHLSLPNRIGNPIPKPEHQDFLFRNGQPALPNYPVPMEGRMFLPQDLKNINGPIRPSALNRHGFNPYPYFPSVNHNASVYANQFSPSQNPIEKNLSDEMKRQLRDGKVVLLSDSVVRSNFTQEKEEVADGGSSVGKNETQKQH